MWRTVGRGGVNPMWLLCLCTVCLSCVAVFWMVPSCWIWGSTLLMTSQVYLTLQNTSYGHFIRYELVSPFELKFNSNSIISHGNSSTRFLSQRCSGWDWVLMNLRGIQVLWDPAVEHNVLHNMLLSLSFFSHVVIWVLFSLWTSLHEPQRLVHGKMSQ